MRSRHLISTTKSTTGWRILYPSAKIKHRENAFGELAPEHYSSIKDINVFLTLLKIDMITQDNPGYVPLDSINLAIIIPQSRLSGLLAIPNSSIIFTAVKTIDKKVKTNIIPKWPCLFWLVWHPPISWVGLSFLVWNCLIVVCCGGISHLSITTFALGIMLPPITIMTHDYSHALNTKNAWWVYHVESVSKMGLVLSITFSHYMGLHVLNWPIRV